MKKRYWYLGTDGKRYYVSRKKDLPYSVRKKRSGGKKLSQKEKYKRKVETGKKISESLKKFYQSEEGKKLKKRLSQLAKKRAKEKKTHYSIAVTALDRLYEIIDQLPEKKYFGHGDENSISTRTFKSQLLINIKQGIRLAEKVDEETGEILVEGEVGYNAFLEERIDRINTVFYHLKLVASTEDEIISDLEALVQLTSYIKIGKELNIEMTELQRYMDFDEEELYEDYLALTQKKGW